MRAGWAAAIAATVLVAACSGPADTPGALSVEDDRRLNDAAAMLDANAVDANATVANGSDPDG